MSSQQCVLKNCRFCFDSILKKIKPHPTEAIVLSYRYGKLRVSDIKELLDYTKSQFPNNTVIAIPDYTSLQSCSKDVLENIISAISEIIEQKL